MASIPLISILLILISTSSASPIPTLIQKACNQTGPNLHNLCISSLSSDPNSAIADLRQLSVISVRIAAANASQTAAYFSAQQTAGDIEPMFYQCLSDCADLYVDVVEQLDTTTAAVVDGADKDALMWVEAAAADVVACEGGCGADATGEIRRRNDGEKKLLNIAITFLKIIAAKKTL